MRTLLVVNPFATSTTPDLCEEIVELLGQKLDLTVKETVGAKHAERLASSAQTNGFELVLSFGGDGTLNEIANGILQNSNFETNPIIAAIPGGNANVFVRNIGWPKSPLEACEQILNSVAHNSVKKIGVGRATTNETSRYFLFNCGIGLDAAVLARMQDRRISGKKATNLAYMGLAIRELLRHENRRNPALEIIDSNGLSQSKAHLALIVNLAPWTYLGELPVALMPKATLDTALDIFGAKDLTIGGISRLIGKVLHPEVKNFDKSFITLSNQESATFMSPKELWVQVDGEVFGSSKGLKVDYFPTALNVLI